MLFYFTVPYPPHSDVEHAECKISESSDNLASFVDINVSSSLTRKEETYNKNDERDYFDIISVNMYRFTCMYSMTHSLKESLCSVWSFRHSRMPVTQLLW